jgi:hypothetical protein
VSSGAHLDVADDFNRLPVHFASARGNFAIIDYLDNSDASFDAADSCKKICLHYMPNSHYSATSIWSADLCSAISTYERAMVSGYNQFTIQR